MYSASDLARALEVNPSTISNWDAKGYIKADFILPSGRKRYSEETLEKIKKGDYKNVRR